MCKQFTEYNDLIRKAKTLNKSRYQTFNEITVGDYVTYNGYRGEVIIRDEGKITIIHPNHSYPDQAVVCDDFTQIEVIERFDDLVPDNHIREQYESDLLKLYNQK